MIFAYLAEVPPIGSDPTQIEMAVLVASAVPVIGGAVVGSSIQEISRISNRFLRWNLTLAFAFRVIAAIAFVAAIVLAVAGDTSISSAIYTGLGSAVFASVGQMIDRSARKSEKLALATELIKHEQQNRQENRLLLIRSIDDIKNQGHRDSVLDKVSQVLAESLVQPMPMPELEASRNPSYGESSKRGDSIGKDDEKPVSVSFETSEP